MTASDPRSRWIVFVRGVDGSGDVYGVYGTETAAQRKAELVNRLLPQDVESEAWAYVMPLLSATTGKQMVRRATT